MRRLLSSPFAFATTLVAACVGVPALAQNGTVHKVPADIPADLSQDVTPQLQAFIDSVPDHSVIEFPENAEYRIDGTISILGRHGLTFEGNGALFRTDDKVEEGERLEIRNRAHWRLDKGSSHIVLRDIHVHGPNPDGGTGTAGWDAAREAQHAFDIDASSHVTLDNVSGAYVFGDGAYLRSNHVVVRNSKFHHVGRQGIAIAKANDVLVENNDIRQVRRGAINIEQYGKDWASDNIRILNNTTGASRLLWMPISGSGVAGSILVAGNVMEAATGIPVIYNKARASGRRGPFVVVDNHFMIGGSKLPAFDLTGIDGMLFAGNSGIASQPKRTMTAVSAHDTKGAIITANVWQGKFKDVDLNEESEVFVGPHGERGEVELIEITGGWGVKVTAEGGTTFAVWKMGETDSSQWDGMLSAFDLKSDAKMALVQLDAAGQNIVSHYVIGEGTATFRGQALPARD